MSKDWWEEEVHGESTAEGGWAIAVCIILGIATISSIYFILDAILGG